jgi:tyrosyl-tRNA synthetase
MVKIVSDEEFKERGLTAPGWELEKSESESAAEKTTETKST